MGDRKKGLLWVAGAMIALAIATWPYVNIAVQAPHDFELDGLGASSAQVASGPTSSKLLRVDLKSRADIQSLAVKHSLFIYEIVSPCVKGTIDPSRRLWSDTPNWIYDAVGAVDLWSRAPDGTSYRTAPSGPRDRAGMVRYSFFFNPEFRRPPNSVKGDPHDPLGDRYEYDLRHYPMDLCVKGVGRGNFGLGSPFPTLPLFQSNLVVIPKRIVSAALQKYDF